jgi:hypothetical protein
MAKKLLAGYDLGGAKITGSGAPTADSDLATRSFVQSEIASTGQVYPIAGWGLAAANGNPESFMATFTLGNNMGVWMRLWIPPGVGVTNLYVAVRDAGSYTTSSTPNQLGFYSDAGTLLSTTTDNNDLFTSTGWRGGALQTPQAAGAGRFAYIGLLSSLSSCTLAALSSGNDAQNPWFGSIAGGGTKRKAMYSFGTSTLPSSFDPTSFGVPTGNMPLVGVGL